MASDVRPKKALAITLSVGDAPMLRSSCGPYYAIKLARACATGRDGDQVASAVVAIKLLARKPRSPSFYEAR